MSLLMYNLSIFRENIEIGHEDSDSDLIFVSTHFCLKTHLSFLTGPQNAAIALVKYLWPIGKKLVSYKSIYIIADKI